jgi:putative redox protein
MAVRIDSEKVNYINIRSIHAPSKTHLDTDAPVDNGGKGSSFSPTDLLATAYLNCMLTIIDLTCKKHAIETHSKGSVSKMMGTNPRRITQLNISISLSSKIPERIRGQIEEAAKNCPVAMSVSSDLKTLVEFKYDL